MLQNPFLPHQCLLWGKWGGCLLVAWSSVLAVIASSPSLPCAPPCWTAVCCPSWKYKMALPISCSGTCFSTQLSLAKATSLAFVNVLKDWQRMTFYRPYQSSVLPLHIHVFSLHKSVICTENTFQWNSLGFYCMPNKAAPSGRDFCVVLFCSKFTANKCNKSSLRLFTVLTCSLHFYQVSASFVLWHTL